MEFGLAGKRYPFDEHVVSISKKKKKIVVTIRLILIVDQSWLTVFQLSYDIINMNVIGSILFSVHAKREGTANYHRMSTYFSAIKSGSNLHYKILSPSDHQIFSIPLITSFLSRAPSFSHRN